MFILSIAVTHIPTSLPSLGLATLTGLNSAAVGLILFAAYQLTKITAKDLTTRLVLLGSATIGSCYTSIWLFPVLTLGGGLVTLGVDWKGWTVLKGRIRARKGRKESPIEERHELPELESSRSTTTEPVEEDKNLALPLTSTPPPGLESNSTLRHRGHGPPVPVEINPVSPTTFTNNFHLTIIQSLLVLTLFFSLLILVIILRTVLKNPPPALQLFTNFFIAGTILFGGGPVVIPLLQGYTSNFVTSQNFLLGFAILQAFPGPNFNFAVYLGALT